MNESSPSLVQSTLSLRSLQKILHNRIIQKKREMHKSHNRAYTDSLWTDIETFYCDNQQPARINITFWAYLSCQICFIHLRTRTDIKFVNQI
jgi:hypothetical protein